MKNITVNGLTFQVEVLRDEDMGEPWKEHDCYGVVSEWTRRGKYPHERVLVSDRGSKRYYDVQASMKLALADGWGCPNPEGKTKGQIAAESVELDYQRLKAWCNGDWWWCYVMVKLLGKDGRVVPGSEYRESLGGIESDSGEYLEEIAVELAEEIAVRVGDSTAVCIAIR